MPASDLSLEEAPEHVLALAAAVDAMVAASAKRCPLPPPRAGHARTAPTPGWLRCMEAMAALETHLAEEAAATSDQVADHQVVATASDQILVSACTTDALGGSRPKVSRRASTAAPWRSAWHLATHVRAYARRPAWLGFGLGLVLGLGSGLGTSLG